MHVRTKLRIVRIASTDDEHHMHARDMHVCVCVHISLIADAPAHVRTRAGIADAWSLRGRVHV